MTWDEWWFQVLGSQGYIERIYSRFPDHLRVPEFRHADVETRHCIREQVLGEAMEAAYRGPVGEVTIACLRDGGTEWTIRNDAGPKTVVSTVEPWWMKCEAETHWCPPCKDRQ